MSQQGRLVDAPSDLETLTGNTGGAISSNAAGNINIVGTGPISVTGNPGTNTLTIDSSASGFPITPYVVGQTGESGYSTIQDGLDAANAAGGGMVYVQPGTYTEDLTLYDGTQIVGAVGLGDLGALIIVGQHTPPTTGSYVIRNCYLQSATNIFYSLAAGTSSIFIIDVAIDVTNGYVFNLPNWTSAGGFGAFDIGEIGSTNDGWVNNTGGATVFMTNITMGAGSGNSMIATGFVELYNCVVQCPVDFQSGTNGIVAGGSVFKNTVTFSGNSYLDISNSTFTTGANTSLNYNSTGSSSLSEVIFDSSVNPCIDGTGVGTLTIGQISYLDDSNISSMLNVSYGVVESGNAHLQNISFDGGSNLLDANGEIWIGSGTGNPAPATITAGTGVTITNAANSITIDASASTPLSFPTDAGTATPAANALNVTGGTGISTTGAGSTVTINLDTPVSVSLGGTGATTLTDGGILLGSGTAAITATAQPTNGQLLIGSTGVDPVLANLTSTGSTVTITNGAGTINLETGTAVPTSFTCDSGSAVPSSGVLTVAGAGGISTSGAGSTVTITNLGAQTISITALDNTDTPYTVLTTDYYLSCDMSAGVLSVKLPDAPSTGRIFVVKDNSGDAATSNLTVTTVTGAVTIDGSTSFIMNTDYEAANFVFNGTSYEVY